LFVVVEVGDCERFKFFLKNLVYCFQSMHLMKLMLLFF